MNKIGDLYDVINPIVEKCEIDPEKGAFLMLGADIENECCIVRGTVKSLVAMIVSKMEAEKDMEFVILKAAEIFLDRKQNAIDEEEQG